MTSKRQDTDAIFEQLFCDYQQPIMTYLDRLVGDSARAEELAQDAFVKAYRNLHRLPEDANRRAWLYRIASNTAYDYLRRRRLVQWLPLQERDSAAVPSRDPEGTLSDRDSVQRALGHLSPSQRSVLILYSVQGYSTREIGEMLGITQGAVKTRLCRARERFRQVYQGDH